MELPSFSEQSIKWPTMVSSDIDRPKSWLAGAAAATTCRLWSLQSTFRRLSDCWFTFTSCSCCFGLKNHFSIETESGHADSFSRRSQSSSKMQRWKAFRSSVLLSSLRHRRDLTSKQVRTVTDIPETNDLISSVNRARTLDSGQHHAVTLLYHDLTANFLTVLSPLLHHPLGIASHHTFAPHPHTPFS